MKKMQSREQSTVEVQRVGLKLWNGVREYRGEDKATLENVWLSKPPTGFFGEEITR